MVPTVAGNILYSGPIDLAQYYIKDHNITKTTSGSITVRFSLGRRILSVFMTVYVPTLLLNIIALNTNYFKVFTTIDERNNCPGLFLRSRSDGEPDCSPRALYYVRRK